MKNSVCFAAVLVSVAYASYQLPPSYHYGPKHRGAYGGAGGHGGGINPMTLLLMQSGGSLGELSFIKFIFKIHVKVGISSFLFS